MLLFGIAWVASWLGSGFTFHPPSLEGFWAKLSLGFRPLPSAVAASPDLVSPTAEALALLASDPSPSPTVETRDAQGNAQGNAQSNHRPLNHHSLGEQPSIQRFGLGAKSDPKRSERRPSAARSIRKPALGIPQTQGIQGSDTSLLAQGLMAQTLQPTSLLPVWSGAQGYMVELAQPLTRWITTITPLQGIDVNPRMLWSLRPSSPKRSLNLDCVAHLAKESTTQRSPAKIRNLNHWLRDCLLADLPDGPTVTALTNHMVRVLQDSKWSGDRLYPTWIENQPAARLGDRPLFVITPAIAQQLQKNNEVIATEWVNQLRHMMGAKPLTLIESQAMMHGVEPGGEFIEGEASWYGDYFQGRQTATGEIYDLNLFTAAHKELPLDTYLKVTNVNNGRTLIVRVNDRGPYIGDRILDLSQGAAQYLGSETQGLTLIRAEIMKPNQIVELQIQPQPTLRVEQVEEDQSGSEPELITMWRP